MVTYKEITDILKTIATNHFLINSFHNGLLDEVDIEKMDSSNFPILYAEPTNANIDTGVLTYTFNIYIINQLKEDLTNRDTVWSNTLEILQDVVAEFKQNISTQTSGGDSGKKYSYVPNEVVLQLPISLTPFTARFANILTGCEATVSLDVNNTNNLCNAPVEPSDYNPST